MTHTQEIDRLMPVKEVASTFQVSRDTLANWTKRGILPPPVRMGGRIFWTASQIRDAVTAATALPSK
jgi:predicted DNA-binding transcriptional regulator AlpA